MATKVEFAMSWQAIWVLKAVLCTSALGATVIVHLVHHLSGKAYIKRLRIGLLVLAALGVAAYFNFGRFHGNKYPATVHVYDMYHYYMGAKYFPELRYDGLYAATAVAAQEEPNALPRIKAAARVRDLSADRVVPVAGVLAQKDRVRSAFRPEHWEQFKADLRWFHGQMSAGLWGRALSDLGFNGPPVWLLAGRLFSHMLGPPHAWQVTVLGWLDVALMAGAFYFVWRAFGLATTTLAIVLFGTNFMQRYGDISGSLLRLDWLAYLLIGASLARLGRYRWAGFFVAYAGLLRIFPLVYVGGVVLRFCYGLIRDRKPWQPEFTLLKSFAASSGLLVVLSMLQPGGATAWPAFLADIIPHAQKLTGKRIGLPYLFVYRGESSLGDLGIKGADPWGQYYRMRQQWYEQWKWAIWLVRCVVLVLFARVCVHSQLHEALLLGIVLVFFFTHPAGYYCGHIISLVLLLGPRLMQAGAVWLLSSLFALMVVMQAVNSAEASSHFQQFLISLWLCLSLLGLLGWLLVRRPASVAAGETSVLAAQPVAL